MAARLWSLVAALWKTERPIPSASKPEALSFKPMVKAPDLGEGETGESARTIQHQQSVSLRRS